MNSELEAKLMKCMLAKYPDGPADRANLREFLEYALVVWEGERDEHRG